MITFTTSHLQPHLSDFVNQKIYDYECSRNSFKSVENNEKLYCVMVLGLKTVLREYQCHF